MTSRKSHKETRFPSHAPCLYLACFSFSEPGEKDDEGEGSFQMIVEAVSPESAVSRLRSSLRKLRDTTSLFHRPSTIYLDGLVRLHGSFKTGLLVNWEFERSRSSSSVQLMNLLPEQENRQRDADAFGFGKNPDETPGEDVTIEPFLDFGGVRVSRDLEAQRTAALDRQHDQEESIAAGYRRAMEAEDERKKAETASKEQAKAERRKRLSSTLAEIDRRKPVR